MSGEDFMQLTQSYTSTLMQPYDDDEATVKITPSDDKGRMQLNKRPLMLMKTSNAQEPANLDRDQGMASNMLRAPTEDVSKSRW